MKEKKTKKLFHNIHNILDLKERKRLGHIFIDQLNSLRDKLSSMIC
jgi:hypothetical protein